jgi:hypothetical protein
MVPSCDIAPPDSNGPVTAGAQLCQQRADARLGRRGAQSALVMEHDLDRIAGADRSVFTDQVGELLGLGPWQRVLIVVVVTDRLRGKRHTRDYGYPKHDRQPAVTLGPAGQPL